MLRRVNGVEITRENYYSLAADVVYMSASQYRDFVKCEAMAMAKLAGEWVEEPTDAMLAGSYVHAAVEGVLPEFRATHPILYTKQGELKAQFRQAEEMAQALITDEFVVPYLKGLHEFVLENVEFAGVQWKAKLDVYVPEQRIVDVKTCKSLNDRTWSRREGRYVSWIEPYLRQLAIYAELERRWSGRTTWLPTYIVAVTKECPPDKAVLYVDEDRIRYELQQVEAGMERVSLVKDGLLPAVRCEHCAYCRATKRIERVMHYAEILEG